MRRAIVILACAGGAAALFATAAQREQSAVAGRTRTAASCYAITWTAGSKPVTRQIPCEGLGTAYVAVAPASP